MSSLLGALGQPADALLDPSRRVFLPFLAASALLALAVLLARGVGGRRAARAILSRRLWLHRSARGDYALIAAKALGRALLFSGWGLSTLAVAAIAAGWLRRHLGSAPPLRVSPAAAAALFTLTAFLVEDWSRFWLHRLMHRVPLLWHFHKVHHSAEVLTPFTLYRTHPVEALLNGARSALGIGLTTGLAAWLFGPSLRAWQVLGVDAVGFVWTLFGANLRHSHVWVSFGRRLEHLFVSPAQHQVHHSSNPGHADKNFGTVLALWDWLGGSLYVTSSQREPLTFGLAGGDGPPRHGLVALLLQPFADAAASLAGATRAVAAHAYRRRALLGLVAGATLLVSGCEQKRLDRAQLLTSFGQCTLGALTAAEAAAAALVTATQAHAAAPTDTTRAAARIAWEKAIDAWQVAELVGWGPAGGFELPGGRNLSESIYAWPDVNRCLTDEQIVSRVYEGAGFANTANSTRGLTAVEYLLFHTGPDNGCVAAHPLNAGGTWAALGADELARRRAAYAARAAAEVAARVNEVVQLWQQPNGFLAEVTTAGRGSMLFPTQHLAVSTAAEAIFGLDTEVKDRKLASPLGLTDCSGMPCMGPIESPWADRGKTHLLNNLAGARLLLEGCPAGDNLGFDDLLVSVGAGSLADKLRADLAAAETALSALPAGLNGALTSDRASVERAYAAVKEITDFLKMEFSMALMIQSKRVEGDND